jgi:hypothetical protein
VEDELTPHEAVALGNQMLSGDITPEFVERVRSLTERQWRDVVALALYEVEYREARKRRRSAAQRRAMTLLRSFLTSVQLAQLDRSGSFRTRGSAGGVYRLYPRAGSVNRVEQHGKQWYWTHTYCLHDFGENAPDKRRLPPADLTIQHLLWLRADEPMFLATANATENRHLMWSAEWRRQVRDARAERAAA